MPAIVSQIRNRLRDEANILYDRLYRVAFLLVLLGIFLISLAEYAWPIRG